MTKLSNFYLLSILTKLLVLLALAKIISLSIWWILPSDGIELQVENNYSPKYQRVDFKNMIENESRKRVSKTVKTVSGISITNMVLKGLYGLENKGFAILALKSSPKKTSIISVGEKFSGYTLKTISTNSVVFTKSSKEYILEIAYVKDIAQKQKKIVRPIIKSSEIQNISRGDIKRYATNPKKIFQEISIVEVKEHNAIKGFKVTRIKRGSTMSQLGLKKGDILIRANNIDLKSYKDALQLYKNIDKISTMQIVVLRDNIEKELIYEIN